MIRSVRFFFFNLYELYLQTTNKQQQRQICRHKKSLFRFRNETKRKPKTRSKHTYNACDCSLRGQFFFYYVSKRNFIVFFPKYVLKQFAGWVFLSIFLSFGDLSFTHTHIKRAPMKLILMSHETWLFSVEVIWNSSMRFPLSPSNLRRC